eukprot:TRINITY_DN427_c0_g1_i1.p1 TRINITY_DN427_c0_g1~~TRINITY_DN427_c0_g1_i1.p1  ORF type:complete len:323 (+),score=24.56 TRINITY_DN427_c0_g1_i1:58-1026(+)
MLLRTFGHGRSVFAMGPVCGAPASSLGVAIGPMRRNPFSTDRPATPQQPTNTSTSTSTSGGGGGGWGRGVGRFVPFGSSGAPSGAAVASNPPAPQSAPQSAPQATGGVAAVAGVGAGAGRGSSGARLAWERTQPRPAPRGRGGPRSGANGGSGNGYNNGYNNGYGGRGGNWSARGGANGGPNGSAPSSAVAAQTMRSQWADRRQRLNRYGAGLAGAGANGGSAPVVFTSSTPLAPLTQPRGAGAELSEDALWELLQGSPADWPQGVETLAPILGRLEQTPLKAAVERSWRGLLHNPSLAPAQRELLLTSLTDKLLAMHAASI